MMTGSYSEGTDCIMLPDGRVCPKSLDNTDYQEYLKWIADGNVANPLPCNSFQETVASYNKAIDHWMDTEAQKVGYRDVVSACSYAGYPNAFQQDGISFITWRSDCWMYLYAMLADVQKGLIPVPTINEIIQQLPKRT